MYATASFQKGKNSDNSYFFFSTSLGRQKGVEKEEKGLLESNMPPPCNWVRCQRISNDILVACFMPDTMTRTWKKVERAHLPVSFLFSSLTLNELTRCRNKRTYVSLSRRWNQALHHGLKADTVIPRIHPGQITSKLKQAFGHQDMPNDQVFPLEAVFLPWWREHVSRWQSTDSSGSQCERVRAGSISPHFHTWLVHHTTQTLTSLTTIGMCGKTL